MGEENGGSNAALVLVVVGVFWTKLPVYISFTGYHKLSWVITGYHWLSPGTFCDAE